jgi:hypothetical protein
MHRLVLLFFISVVVVHCEKNETPTEPPNGRVLRTTGIEHIVTAGGFLVAPVGNRFTLALSARSYDDGTVKGQLQIQVRSSTDTAHGHIDCLSVQGDTAWISGAFTHSPDSELLVGGSFLLGVRDGGTGRGAQPDERTPIVTRRPGDQSLSCEEPWLLPFSPWDGGAVLIK